MTTQEEWNQHYADGQGWRPATDEEVDALASHLPTLGAVSRALDIGCGTGDYTLRLYGLGYDEVLGIDWAPAAIEEARNRTLELPGLEFQVGDFTALKGVPRFDLITARLVYPVVDDRPALLAAVSRLLAPEGVFAVTAPHPDAVPESRRSVALSDEHLRELDAWAGSLLVIDHDGLRIALCTPRPEDQPCTASPA